MKGKNTDAYTYLDRGCLLNKRAHWANDADWMYLLNQKVASATTRSTAVEDRRESIENLADEDFVPYRIIKKEYGR